MRYGMLPAEPRLKQSMPSCSTCVTTDIDQFRNALRPSDGELTVTGRGHFEAAIVRVTMSRLWMQSAREKLARTWYTEVPADRGSIAFLLAPGMAVQQGVEMSAGDISLKCRGEPVWQRLGHSAQWGSISLSLEDWSEIASVIAGRELLPACRSMLVTPKGPALATLRRAHSATANLAETTPAMIADPEVARGLEQALIQAMVDCIATTSPHDRTVAQRHHTTVMTQFRRLLEEHDGEAVYMPQLCATIGVSGRTLRLCCQEHLGTSPKRYLYLRRMTLVRRVLSAANATGTRVTDVAMRFGFWELGRFSVQYKSLFGESPSATLRQATGGAAS
jgi:AraC-like DNA-binding protein